MVMVRMEVVFLERSYELRIGSVGVGITEVSFFVVGVMKVRLHMMVRSMVWFDKRRVTWLLDTPITAMFRRSRWLVYWTRLLHFTILM